MQMTKVLLLPALVQLGPAIALMSQYASAVEWDVLSARADLLRGVYTSGCGHHMHAECWRRYMHI